jgi:hypothetical protein
MVQSILDALPSSLNLNTAQVYGRGSDGAATSGETTVSSLENVTSATLCNLE